MKKIDLILTAAAVTIAGCTSDDALVSKNGEVEMPANAAIDFHLTVPNQTRATTLTGSDAAKKLNNEFVVFGTKHISNAENGTSANDQNVFVNYRVEYEANSAGKTESNTHNWEYVGKVPYDETKVAAKALNQTVKYWDYSAANGYTFTAFAAKNGLADNGGVSKITKITASSAADDANKSVYDKGYTVEMKSGSTPENIYFSDRMEVPKTKYGQPVVLTFRNFGSRVRVGFYETVPGYNVKINKFYYAKSADAAVTTYGAAVTTYGAMDTENTTNFAAALWYVNKGATEGNTLTVSYCKDGAVQNQPTVTNTTTHYTPTLTLGSNINSATALGTTADSPTWDTANGGYTTVYPNEGCSNPMLIRCDYTLTSTDGSGETIAVKNARVVVPAQYMQWKPNYSYTYLFKISDKTNGTTGDNPQDPDNPGTDPEGLHPITFDAVVVDQATGNQEYISSVATNSVTTYANGSKVAENKEYKTGEDIYVVTEKTSDRTVISPSGIGDDAGKAQVYLLSRSATEGDLYAQLNGAKLGITLTAMGSINDGSTAAQQVSSVPLADGTSVSLSAVKFTPNTQGYYAYVYTTTKYVAPQYTSAQSDSYSADKTYYRKTTDDVYYTASGISADNFEANRASLYYVSTQGTAGVYDIKVIKVGQ